MQSDFEVFCQGARERIAVPPFPLAAIRNVTACRPTRRSIPRWSKPIAGVLASVTLIAAGVAEVWNGTHVSLDRSGGFEVRAEKMTSLKNPTPATLRTFASRADFAVILPAGLPSGTTIASVHMFGSSALLLQYNLPGAWRRSDHVLALILANPKTIGGSSKTLPHAYNLRLGREGAAAVQWAIGHEAVIVTSSSATPAELARIKNAMIAQSLARAVRAQERDASPVNRFHELR